MPKSRWFAGKCVMSRPAKFTLPELGVSSPAIMRNKVVLPQPDGPRKQTSLPSGTLRSTWSTAYAALKRLVTACNVRCVMRGSCWARIAKESKQQHVRHRGALLKRDAFVANQLFEQPDQREIDCDDED